ncbi:hypothetical protein BO71DRAFT_403219 [Aspergillus ellipticus CBS 707.79]|uniref:Prokaryotic-type class I peptide chain release factors domain-containing protein n=1 Tax=Aspergillus ellipticus CBS 707.79 TaxID=1448320 RepID=A0A319CVF1_9EURO|nr:hypothetical protein BO71DRAFT_403219 [Aspergillus ellipticus CBS 707.79]
MFRLSPVRKGLESFQFLASTVRPSPPVYSRLALAFPLSSPCPTIATRTFASRRAAIASDNGLDAADDDLTAARDWVARLNANTIPRDISEISFSRSSGPGGQNVNKVNSKATLRVPLDSLLPLVPRYLHPALLSSRYVAARTQSLVIQSEESRKQTANVESCYDKLHQLLKNIAELNIPGETSQEQRDHVRKL